MWNRFSVSRLIWQAEWTKTKERTGKGSHGAYYAWKIWSSRFGDRRNVFRMQIICNVALQTCQTFRCHQGSVIEDLAMRIDMNWNDDWGAPIENWGGSTEDWCLRNPGGGGLCVGCWTTSFIFSSPSYHFGQGSIDWGFGDASERFQRVQTPCGQAWKIRLSPPNGSFPRQAAPPRKKKNRRKKSRGAFATAFQELNPACGVALLKTWLGQERKAHSSLWWQFWCGLRRRPRKSWHVCPHCLLAFSFFKKLFSCVQTRLCSGSLRQKRLFHFSAHTSVHIFLFFKNVTHRDRGGETLLYLQCLLASKWTWLCETAKVKTYVGSHAVCPAATFCLAQRTLILQAGDSFSPFPLERRSRFFPRLFLHFFPSTFHFFLFSSLHKIWFFSSKLAGWMGIKNHECPDCFLLSGFGTTDSFSLAPVTRRVFTVRRKNEAGKRARRPALYLFSSSFYFKGKT